MSPKIKMSDIHDDRDDDFDVSEEYGEIQRQEKAEDSYLL